MESSTVTSSEKSDPREQATARLSQMLEHSADEVMSCSLHQLMQDDGGRFSQLSRRVGPFLVDFSKQRVTRQTMDLLVWLASNSGLAAKRKALLEGEIVNASERRPALHPLLRWPHDKRPPAGCESVVKAIHGELQRMEELVERIRSGGWRGATGETISDVVNIGVGGSDLGPRMACQALSEFAPQSERKMAVHFVSTMDGAQLAPLLRRLDPKRTLFILSSKSFTTVDTQFNMRTALSWLMRELGQSESSIKRHHILGVSSREDRMTQWGLPTDNQLHFAEGVGGRFSLWSPIGISVGLALGMPTFHELLAGAHWMDRHFAEAPMIKNLPVLLAMLGVWNSDFLHIPSHAVLPYDGRLALLPSYLQQLEMESNGKSTTAEGIPIDGTTCPILWGEVGPNAQHAFFQLLHQGTHDVSCEFIAPVQRYTEAHHDREALELQAQHRLTLANCLAQSQLLALGDDALDTSLGDDTISGYRGNQPSTTLLLDALTPWSLGALLALYEHKVFVQSVIWKINPFDQPGVELGKRLATGLHDILEERAPMNDELDASTRDLLAHIHMAVPRDADLAFSSPYKEYSQCKA
ncbi:hypothetical protein L861_02300 [Litchfieldella anticariensis FP35 = DSM 16096]|uniref:Glucose-6-phosphate isomerase n=1 Tax=Litchfieldella anticariensis (strain DSM 16096 / CECT 5854 / CIP 108499 / LMG 22089 / FP35) TaxID=1121939 RepID=S2KUB3_LITA3|nr:glucose-6-phosphate isomerase [Halomonas anticariensis]EPC04163.1 hypothetical protein L861_02300 [Halomonas anticariensis FP35 = DSM 16096]